MNIYKSYAKINLFLDVISKYRSGYHEIRSLFSEISLFDTIKYKKNRIKELKFLDRSNILPEDNLLKRAGDEILKHIKGISQGYNFEIIKNIPIGGGLGGGSSNAAAILKLLNNKFNIGLNSAKLEEIGENLGADVPFFIKGGLQKAAGLGQRLEAVDSQKLKLHLILVIPEVKVNTQTAYKLIDEYGLCFDKPDLKKKYDDLVKAILNGDYYGTIKNVYNKFEEVVFKKEKSLDKISNDIVNSGADKVLMSGSGSTLIGFFESRSKLLKSIKLLTNQGYDSKEISLRI